jgi:hypothetical protein
MSIFMLTQHLQQLGINPRIIQQYLTECLEATKQYNEELAAELDPLAYQRTELVIAQVELLLAYLI